MQFQFSPCNWQCKFEVLILFAAPLPKVHMQLKESDDTLCPQRWTNKSSIYFFAVASDSTTTVCSDSEREWNGSMANHASHIHRANWLFFIRSVPPQIPNWIVCGAEAQRASDAWRIITLCNEMPVHSFVNWCRCWLLHNFSCLFLGHLEPDSEHKTPN